MKKICLLVVSTFIFSSSVFATPSSMTLASPTRIQRIGVNMLKLTFMLPCSGEYALDWSKIVMTHDDSGDQVAAVGLVYSASEGTCAPSTKLKKYTLEIDPAEYGYKITSKGTADFEAMDLAN